MAPTGGDATVNRTEKVALGVGAAALVGVGAVAGYDALHRTSSGTVVPTGSGTGTLPSGSGSGASASSAGLSIGQPFLTGSVGGAVLLRRRAARFGRRVRTYDVGAPLFALGGLASIGGITAQPGQVLNVPLSVTNNGPAALYFSAHGYVWENTSGTLSIPGIGSMAIGGHLTSAEGSPNAATGSAAASGGTWAPTLQSEGTLSYTGQQEGVYVHLHVYSDSAMTQEISGSPVAAWTNAFLTVGLPGISSLISFGIGTPSAS